MPCLLTKILYQFLVSEDSEWYDIETMQLLSHENTFWDFPTFDNLFFLAPYLCIDQKVLFICMSAYVIHQYVYCISKNLINRCRRFWWINFQRMMLLQWQGHKKKKRKGRSIWIPRWLVEIQRTILVNWDKDLWFLFLILYILE